MPTPAISPRRCRRRSTIGSGSSRCCAAGHRPASMARSRCERFHEREAASPLPRAYQWADGSAYVNHVALVRQARGAEMPDSFWHDPLMYQGGSDGFLGPRDDIPLADESWGCDLEAEVVVVTGDVPQGVSARGGAGLDPAGRADQRRQPAQSHPGRTGQGLRLLPVEAGVELFAGVRHARCARRALGGTASCTARLRSN